MRERGGLQISPSQGSRRVKEDNPHEKSWKRDLYYVPPFVFNFSPNNEISLKGQVMRLRRLTSQAVAKVAKLDTISNYHGYNVTYKLTIVAFPNITFCNPRR